MPVTFEETPDSRNYEYAAGVSDSSRPIVLLATGSADEAAIVDALLADPTAAPNSMVGARGERLYRKSIRCEPLLLLVDEADKCQWRVTVSYGPFRDDAKADRTGALRTTLAGGGEEAEETIVDPVPGTPQQDKRTRHNFEIGSQTVHVTTSLNTYARYVAEGADGVDNKGAIGVASDGTVEGVDIEEGVWRESETWVFAAEDITTGYKNNLRALVGCINADTFRGQAPGEVKFLGATGNDLANGYVEITFSWAIAKDQTNLDVGGVITVASKPGWAYVWTQFKAEKSGGRLTQVPLQVSVERVHRLGNFANLNIGVD